MGLRKAVLSACFFVFVFSVAVETNFCVTVFFFQFILLCGIIVNKVLTCQFCLALLSSLRTVCMFTIAVLSKQAYWL